MTTIETPPPETKTGRSARKTVSYCLPVYNEEGGIRLFHERLVEATDSRAEYDYEFVYVNDGSKDDSLLILRELATRDPRVHIVDFARNYGHQIAITAALDHATGDAVIIMDTDLQDPPPVSLELIDAWEKGGEIVYAQRRTRKDTAFKKFTAHAYYRLLRRFAEVDIPVDTGDFRLLDRRVADELRRYRERSRFIRGIVASMGYHQVAVPFDRDDRVAGETNYPLTKMIRLAADGVTSFSTTPLKAITRLGFCTVVLSILGIIYALVLRVFYPEISVEGWTLLMIVVLFLGGVQMLSIGVIGTYVGRIYKEVQNRPLYLVRETVQHNVNEVA